MDTQQIKERLRSSLEMRTIRNNMLIMIPLAPLMMWTLTRSFSGTDLLIVSAIICAITILPFLIFYMVRIFRIFRKPEHYIFCRTKLTAPHAGSWRGSMYFTVLMEDPADGRKFIVNTHEIFSTRSITDLNLEEYINSTVTIAYNRETEMVVVIG